MGKVLLYATPPVLLWWAVLGRVPAIRRRPNDPVLRSYWSALLCLAGAVTVLIPSIQLPVDRVVGVPNLALLVGHGLALGCATSAQAFLLYSSSPPDEARPRVRRQVWLLVGTLIAMAVLFTVGQTQHATFDLFSGDVTAWPAVLFWLLYLANLGLALINAVRLIWRWRWASLTDRADRADRADRDVLRVGLGLLTAGAAVGLVYVGYHLVFLVASQRGQTQRLGDPQLVTQGLSAASVVLIVAGFNMPTWGPRVGLVRWLRWVGRYRAARRLYPLWRVLWRAVPSIALEPPSVWWRDALTLRGGVSFRLQRLCVELRDGQVKLRPWRDPRAATTAQELGRLVGLDGEALEAVVEAATLLAAAQLRRRAAAIGEKLGRRAGLDGEALEKVVVVATRAAVPANTDGQPAGGEPAAAAGPGGGDLDSESAWLGRVAGARRSRVVHAVLARQRALRRPLLQRSAEQAAAAVEGLAAAAVADGARQAAERPP
jgi:hypothetical protein